MGSSGLWAVGWEQGESLENLRVWWAPGRQEMGTCAANLCIPAHPLNLSALSLVECPTQTGHVICVCWTRWSQELSSNEA